jgi:hypothetical protein
VSHDEALPNFSDILDQATLGRAFVRQLLRRPPPSVAWQVDSFGHSVTTNKLLAGMDYRAVVYNRVRWDLKKLFAQRRALLFNWSFGGGGVVTSEAAFGGRAQHDSGGVRSMTSVMLKDHYNSPQTLGLESGVPLTKSAVDSAAAQVKDWVAASYSAFPTRHVLFLVGEDNAFKAAGQYYDGLDGVIDRLRNSRFHAVDARYSTLEEYLDAVDADGENRAWPTFSGSLSSYQDKPLHAWSGFYSSRPFLKQQIKSLSAVLHGAETLHALAISTTDRAMIDRDVTKGRDDDLEEHVAMLQSRHFRLKTVSAPARAKRSRR